jgi:hypothetical protein
MWDLRWAERHWCQVFSQYFGFPCYSFILPTAPQSSPSSTHGGYRKNSAALSPQANYTDWASASCRQNLVPSFVDRRVSRGQRGGSPTVVILSFLDRTHGGYNRPVNGRSNSGPGFCSSRIDTSEHGVLGWDVLWNSSRLFYVAASVLPTTAATVEISKIKLLAQWNIPENGVITVHFAVYNLHPFRIHAISIFFHIYIYIYIYIYIERERERAFLLRTN